MKAAIIKSNYTPYGGGEKYTTRLIHAFAQRFDSVDVLTTVGAKWGNSDKNVGWIRIRQFKYNNYLRLTSFNASVNAYLKENKYDCILGMDRTEYQTHIRAGGGCHAAWLDRRCAESSSLRCLSFRLNPFHREMLRIERRAFLAETLKRIVCNSFLVRDELLRYFPGTKEKLKVVHNGVQWNEYTEAFAQGMEEKDAIRIRLSLREGIFYFLYVGSGYGRKGLAKAIEALKMLPEETELIVVGKDRHEQWYQRLAKKLGLSARVHFFGPQKNVIPFFQAADAFVLPTLYDPFSNASLEALAMGLYTVTSSANGCSEVIREGAGSVIQDLQSIASVSEAMRSALNAHLSKPRIRETVKHLDFDVQLKKIVDICIEDCGQVKGL